MIRALVLALAAAGPAAAQGCGAGDAAAVERFVAALVARDPEGVRAGLPTAGPLHLTGTIEAPWQTDEVPAAEIDAGLAPGGGLAELLLDGGPDDDVADLVEALGGAWVEATPGEYRPEGGDGRTFLRLGCEGGRPVIGEIGWPAA